MEERWADPNYRNETVAKMRAAAVEPDINAMKSNIAKILWEDPEYRAKQHGEEMRTKLSSTRKKQWADPEYREMMLRARKKST